MLEKLSSRTKLTIGQLEWFSKSASRRYKIYEIPKKTGGTRVISHPSRPLKALQRWLNRLIFSQLPLHNSATAYRKGRSILHNALPHLDTRYTLRIDFENFFPSFKVGHVYNFLKLINISHKMELSEEDIKFSALIVSRNGELTIGAPSSPILTNAMMFGFDTMMDKYCRKSNLVYTRYADDIFVSSFSQNCLADALEHASEISGGYDFADLVINKEKIAFLSKKYRRSITGLNISSQGKISIGRETKRKIKTLVFKIRSGQGSSEDLEYLTGMLCYIRSVEPEFIERLTLRYGEIVSSIIRRETKVRITE